MKSVLNEQMDLMRRMNLFENVGKARIEVSKDELIDKLNELSEKGGGTYVSITYVKPQTFYNTRRSWRGEDVTKTLSKYGKEGNESWFDSINNFNSDESLKKLNIEGMISIQKYNCHWTTRESYNKAFSEYSENLRNLRQRMGIARESDGMLGDNHNQRDKTDYGATINQTGNLSKDFNLAGSPKVVSRSYVVGGDGMIKGIIPNDIVKALNKPKDSLEKAVKEVLIDNPELLEQYKTEKAKLDAKFKGKNLLFDRMLCIVATIDGTAYYYINKNIQIAIKEKSDIYVKSSELYSIAMRELSDSITNLDQYQGEISSENFANEE